MATRHLPQMATRLLLRLNQRLNLNHHHQNLNPASRHNKTQRQKLTAQVLRPSPTKRNPRRVVQGLIPPLPRLLVLKSQIAPSHQMSR